jgi:1-pyrroline-5-carboxylate dehydrogenase
MISTNIPQTPKVTNEPINEYRPGSAETSALQKAMDVMSNEQVDIPCYIGGQEVRTGQVEMW